MNSLKSLPARAACTAIRAKCIPSPPPSRLLSSLSTHQARRNAPTQRLPFPTFSHVRSYASKTSADEVIEQIQEQYATARDEFEIAAEETEKKTVYAADDRAAAREELDALKALYNQALQDSNAEEVKTRVGHRIRELDHAVQALEQKALED